MLLVDKPAGFTSHDVVAIARGAAGTRRVGHTGTLDPFATGLLVLLIGQATRLAQYVDGEPKVYETTIAFGTETDTDDLTGATVREAAPPSPADIERAIAELTGPLDQMPPDYSAKQAGGVRAYDAARKGTPIVLTPSPVTVHSWEITGRGGDSLTARITCSGGTYIRSLGRDLGRLTGSAAHLTALRRIASGPFDVAAACSLDALRARDFTITDMRSAVLSLPAQQLTTDETVRVTHGNRVAATIAAPRAVLLSPEGRMLAIADRADDLWQPVTVLNG